MNKVAILTDSTAYLPDELRLELNISVVALTLIWEGETLRDGVDIQPEQFYQRMATTKTIPSTSLVTTQEMETCFKTLLDQGFDVLGIFLSSKFSGTVESAIRARADNPHFAERVAVFDSLFTTMAMGWPVLAAARAARSGASLADCQHTAEQARDNSGVLFVVETLEYLRRGGRIGGAQALLGSALNIKPILEMRAGRIESVEKVRTKTRAIERMLDLAVERIGDRTPVRLASVHANVPLEAEHLLTKAKELLHPKEAFSCPLSPAIGTHAGPGTVALAYMAGVE